MAKSTDKVNVKLSRALGRAKIHVLLSDALERMHAVDEKGLNSYRRAIASLRDQSAEAVRAASEIEKRAPRGAYPLRWALLYVLADLNDPATIDHFVRSAVQKVPDESSRSQACETPADGELLVRVMAVEGIERLLPSHREAAIEALFDVLRRQPHVAVRRPAARALLTADPGLRDRIDRELGRNQKFVLDLRRASVEELTAHLDQEDLRNLRPRPGVGHAPKLRADLTAPRVSRPRKG